MEESVTLSRESYDELMKKINALQAEKNIADKDYNELMAQTDRIKAALFDETMLRDKTGYYYHVEEVFEELGLTAESKLYLINSKEKEANENEPKSTD